MNKVITVAMVAMMWLVFQSAVFAHQDPEHAGYIGAVRDFLNKALRSNINI